MLYHIILFGPPGSGKGTQANIISNNFNFFHVSTGHIFRKHVENFTNLGNIVNYYIKNGKLVPDKITNKIIKNELFFFIKNKYKKYKGIIYDGYPRTFSQVKYFNKLLNNFSLGKVNLVFSLLAKEKVIIDRIFFRSVISGRSDDNNLNIIRGRILDYYKNIEIIFKYYRKIGCLYEINAEKNINDVFILLSKIINKKIK